MSRTTLCAEWFVMSFFKIVLWKLCMLMLRWQASWRRYSKSAKKRYHQTHRSSCTTVLWFRRRTWTSPCVFWHENNTGKANILLQYGFMCSLLLYVIRLFYVCALLSVKLLVRRTVVAVSLGRGRNCQTQTRRQGSFGARTSVRAGLPQAFCEGKIVFIISE